MQFGKHLILHRRGTSVHGRGAPVGLGEGYDVTDARLARQEHHQPVQTKRYAAMGWCAVLERFQEESEPFFGQGARETDKVHHLLLDLPVVDTDAPRTEFDPIQHQVVELSPHQTRIGVELLNVLLEGHGEHVMFRLPVLLLFVPGE